MSINDEFERKVSLRLASIDYDCIIGYENSTLKLFREAKEKGKITILDLAQIHHKDIVKISEPFFTADVMDFEKTKVNPYKQEALKYTDYIFTLSTFAADSLISNQISPLKIFKINLGVDLELFSSKKQYNTESRPFEFLFVGTIMRRKGIDLLLQVWRNLSLVDCKLTLVGPVSDGKDILEMHEELIEYHPFLPHSELVNKYQQADVFVFPSYLDSWAQTVIEAMACGTPVIVSEHTGAKDAVSFGGGFIIPVNDPEALKEKMLYFYNNRAAVERMGKEANFIAQNYTWERYNEQIVAALNDIAIREGIKL